MPVNVALCCEAHLREEEGPGGGDGEEVAEVDDRVGRAAPEEEGGAGGGPEAGGRLGAGRGLTLFYATYDISPHCSEFLLLALAKVSITVILIKT